MLYSSALSSPGKAGNDIFLLLGIPPRRCFGVNQSLGSFGNNSRYFWSGHLFCWDRMCIFFCCLGPEQEGGNEVKEPPFYLFIFHLFFCVGSYQKPWQHHFSLSVSVFFLLISPFLLGVLELLSLLFHFFASRAALFFSRFVFVLVVGRPARGESFFWNRINLHIPQCPNPVSRITLGPSILFPALWSCCGRVDGADTTSRVPHIIQAGGRYGPFFLSSLFCFLPFSLWWWWWWVFPIPCSFFPSPLGF